MNAIETPNELLTKEAQDFAKAIAYRFYRKYQKVGIEVDEILAIALFALCEASRRFNSARGTSFTTFAYLRIRGEIFDSIRNTIAHQTIPLDGQIEGSTLSNDFSTNLNTTYSLCPAERYEQKQRMQRIQTCLRMLPVNEQSILIQKYFYDYTHDKIGSNVGGRSKSWVSKLHTRALENMKQQLLES